MPEPIGADRKLVALFVSLVAFAVLAACGSNYPAPVFIESPECADLEHGVLPVTDFTLSTDGIDVSLQVEIANNSSKRTQGLMCRESIPPDTGMLFTYESDRTSGFWMYNTYVPIDILFIDSSGNVSDKITMMPCPREELTDDDWKLKCATDASSYIPSSEWRYTLEIPADWLSSQNIGDSVVRSMNVSWPGFEMDDPAAE
ncbi:MAG TPA: DUF192 domain-containing protein [Dehalococcoidia bacterium]|jgi:uncharacterized membrane protein (UPF0127 family)|nr:DUF192 domain-containing protein [Dehalococcoidia bacterium]